ncbi:MAG: rod-binding protein [Proteobacteria bacterium]|nr:rod-binding protein [Pseudomonadota bacterium]
MIIKDAGPVPISVNNQTEASKEKLKKACADFESIFLSYMLKTMRASSSEPGLVGKSHESKILYAMYDEKLSEEIAGSGGIGLANILLEKLKNRL